MCEEKMKYACYLVNYISSVAIGGGGANGAIAPPIGLKSMRNSMFFAVSGADFCPKNENSPPKRNWGESGRSRDDVDKRKWALVHMKTFYFL